MRKKIMLPIIILCITFLFSGCSDDIIGTDISNMKFMKHAIKGEYIDSTPAAVKFENKTYQVSDKNIEYKMLDKRVGYVDKNKDISCWIWTVKGTGQSDEIALYNYNCDNKYVIAYVKK